jgi:hypothetical protein
VDETGKILGAQQRAKGTNMLPKQRPVKFAPVLLPFLCFAVERRVKNKFCLLPTEDDLNLEISAPQGKCAANVHPS